MSNEKIKRCAIVVDNYKLPVFVKQFEINGYTEITTNPLGKNQTAIAIEIDASQLKHFSSLVQTCNDLAKSQN